jgi:1-acyl-sn-glycerol-3-phosphate acyltransferase
LDQYQLKEIKLPKITVGFFEDISKMIKESDRPLIIFPQGTRVLPDERPPFKKGASRIYEELKISCQPVAINSGYVWPKKGQKNINQTITISILQPIISGYPKEEFIKILENNIYKELDLLN